MKQQALYGPTKAWLESRGFRVIIAGDKRNFVIPVSDLFAGAYKVPDLLGVDENNRVVIAEVETDKEKFFHALGRCMLWRCMATFVYLVYPKSKIARARFFSKIGIGLLEVDEESHGVTELIGLPAQEGDLWSVTELHPTDPPREQQLAALIRSTLA